MNVFYLVAALLIVLIALAHSVLGERLLIMPLYKGDLSFMPLPSLASKRVMRFAWHLTTVAWWGLGVLVIFYARSLNTTGTLVQIRSIAVLFLVSCLMALVFTRGRHFSWIVFLAISLLLWFG
ncbi:hypothetical protein KJ966_23590 [bacterium]|nr:hypothetical protein [bacterium]